MKTNDQRINGELQVRLYEHPTDQCPNRNDPMSGLSAVVANLHEAREWLNSHGGYASLSVNFDGPFISGWDVYRIFPQQGGYRSVGFIQPL